MGGIKDSPIPKESLHYSSSFFHCLMKNKKNDYKFYAKQMLNKFRNCNSLINKASKQASPLLHSSVMN